MLLWPLLATAETLRIATWNVDLTRRGPGLLLRDILRGDDPGVQGVVQGLVALDADVVLLTGVDWDLRLAALAALAAELARAGRPYPHLFATAPNTGVATGLDLDGNGRLGEARDAQGFGWFAGMGGMAILSRLPINAAGVRDLSQMLWRDLPGNLMPAETDPAIARIQRLSTTAHWIVPVALPDGGTLNLLAWHATPPVFDGPEDRNGRRNHDEAALWLHLLQGTLPGESAPAPPFVLLGDANLDPADGDGRPAALTALLTGGLVQDTAPRAPQHGTDPGHRGDPALDTARYPPPLGGLRLDYVLPSADLGVAASGGDWPADPALRHRPVWVDIVLP